MTDTIRSKTPCPECGGQRWRRWQSANGELERVWSRYMTARIDWPEGVASMLDFGTCVDICDGCKLVVR